MARLTTFIRAQSNSHLCLLDHAFISLRTIASALRERQRLASKVSFLLFGDNPPYSNVAAADPSPRTGAFVQSLC